MKFLDIGTVSEQTGLPSSTLRYYEEIGLIESVGRNGLRRQYEPRVLTQLSLIALGKSAGFSLEDIARMFGPEGQPDLPRDELHARADALDQQIKHMTALSNALRHVADCPAPSHMECQTFKRMVRIAGKRNPARKT
ncbi:MerR family transcriptional regulator [Cohaesibacter sp. CAU 1516]|uniref:helix-turn-helix domain-containing protein n=1 Tax=Cohaesibacter sp. CAU 1516 TaxID=2576038 RepID=UPI0010FDC20E|nr:helix-turn-helix domain-containing protein [Cohaesibacter sp. CAU 1516]TLP45545.1 MerR family transcriptional regulator [Cohaesibacter sp. CAU 1516]